MIKDYINVRLKALGLPTDDITYSLGYCQGDFVKTLGEIEDYDLYLKHLEDLNLDVQILRTLLSEHDLKIIVDEYSEIYLETYSCDDLSDFERPLTKDLKDIMGDIKQKCYEVMEEM